MNLPWVSLAAIGVGALISITGTLLLLIAAFRRSVVWGLVVLLAPLGNLIFTCKYWTEAKAGFLASIIGAVIALGGFCTIPEVQASIWKAADVHGATPTPAPAPDLTAQIQEHRQRLEGQQAAFAKDGVELTRQYQALEAQRKTLKSADTAAIIKFNEAAAAYQARNATRKQMQQQIETTQRELDALLDTRARNTAPHVPAKK